MNEVKDLGWCNEWLKWVDNKPVWPEIVAKCQALGHRVTETDEGRVKQRGLDTVTRCDICGYKYHTDSSD